MTVSRNDQNEARVVLKTWLVHPLAHEVKAALERLLRAEDVAHVAVMPDVHLAAGVCVGNVVATTQLIYPQAVGSDIGCGMLAVAFDAGADLIALPRRAERLLDALPGAAPAMRHRSLDLAPPLPDELTRTPLSAAPLTGDSQREGRIGLGTLGRGNHFIEFQADEDECLWLMIHSGSRHMGQAINAHHARSGVRAGGGLYYLDSESDEGTAYLSDMTWATRFADANRREMLASIAAEMQRMFGVGPIDESLITCDHNHLRREEHGGRTLWVHRKGAMRAGDGEPGILPGTMGTHSFHVVGRGCADALCSSAHGAGRRMSRTDARRSVRPRRLEQQLGEVYFDRRLTTQLCEEAPAAYKDIDAVFRAQKELTRMTRRLRPILVYKGA